MIDDERIKILKINTKYKKIVHRHYRAKVFQKEYKVIVFLYRERFLYGFVFQAIKEKTWSLHHNKED